MSEPNIWVRFPKVAPSKYTATVLTQSDHANPPPAFLSILASPMIPSIPTLAQSVVQILTPSLPYILVTETNQAISVTLPPAIDWPVITQTQLELGQSIWELLWPYIMTNYEAKIAAQEIAQDPDSPTWQSTLEQGLIGILLENDALTTAVAQKLDMTL